MRAPFSIARTPILMTRLRKPVAALDCTKTKRQTKGRQLSLL
jgi:hypothetical protein